MKRQKNQSKLVKKNQQEPKDLTVELTIVPQGMMVKPRTYIAAINKNSLESLVKDTLLNEIKNNTGIRKTLRRIL